MSENQEQIIEELVSILTQIDDAKEMSSFLNEILTDGERKNLNLRWRLLELLKDGITQRDIASQLHISLCKITRGSKILKDDDSTIKKWLEK